MRCWRCTSNTSPTCCRSRPISNIKSTALTKGFRSAWSIEAELILDWYLPRFDPPVSTEVRAEFRARWSEALEDAIEAPPTWVLRDFHSPNLLWLPKRKGLARLGILDFQDAVMGPAAYDLASLLQDARVDVAESTELTLLGRYLRRRSATDTEFDGAQFIKIYVTLAAQRASKIMGIFSRLDARDGKPQYLRHMPRIWGYLQRSLAHPALAPLNDWYSRRHVFRHSRRPDTRGQGKHAWATRSHGDTQWATLGWLDLGSVTVRAASRIAPCVLAAGLGNSRMRPFNGQAPKPLVQVGGKALIDHVLDRLADTGVACAVVNVHHLADQIERHLQARQRPRIVISDERHELLGTGGGVVKALAQLGAAPFFHVNSDTIWIDRRERPNLGRLWRAAFDADRMDALLLLAPTATSIGYEGRGDFAMAADGPLVWRRERDVVPFVYAGAAILAPALFAGAPAGAFGLADLWRRAAEAERLYGLRLEGVWMHVGTPEAVAAAEADRSTARCELDHFDGHAGALFPSSR